MRTTTTATMLAPARCNGCGKVYDVGEVTVIARYADCSVWKAPCCGITCDDRQRWGGNPDQRNGYTVLPRGSDARLHWAPDGRGIMRAAPARPR